MPFLIDTNVAICLRDGDDGVADRLAELGPELFLSVVSRVELENGVFRDPAWSNARRAALDIILTRIATLDFGEAELEAYREMLTAVGYSKRKTIDRMIAATALAHGLTVVTMNGNDFCDVPGLKLKVWETPATPHPPS